MFGFGFTTVSIAIATIGSAIGHYTPPQKFKTLMVGAITASVMSAIATYIDYRRVTLELDCGVCECIGGGEHNEDKEECVEVEIEPPTPSKPPSKTKSIAQKIFENVPHDNTAGIGEMEYKLRVKKYDTELTGGLYHMSAAKAKMDGMTIHISKVNSSTTIHNPPQYNDKTILVQIDDPSFDFKAWQPSSEAIITDVLGIGQLSQNRTMKARDVVLKKEISSGIASSVHLGEHKDGTLIIVKKISDLNSDLICELIILKLLGNCKNIITLYGYNVSLRESILLLEIGIPLNKYVKMYDLTPANRSDIAKDIINGVKSLHTINITHNDIKPENVVVVDGVSKLIDFNLSKRIIDGHEQHQIQTIMYRAPEAIGTYKPIGTGVDFWSIGCVMYELATEKILFDVWDEDELYLSHIAFFNNKNNILSKCVAVDRWYLDHLHKFLTLDPDERMIKYTLKHDKRCKIPKMNDELMAIFNEQCEGEPTEVIDYIIELLHKYSKHNIITPMTIKACFVIACQYMSSDKVYADQRITTAIARDMVYILNNYI